MLFNILIEYEKMTDDEIYKNLLQINVELYKKYNSYNHLYRMKCIENDEIINLEKKFDSFSIDKDYNYVIDINNSKISLPKINLDLSRIKEFYKKSGSDSTDELIKEITKLNETINSLIKEVTLNKLESIKEKNIIYYLFYFMSRAFFYIIMNNNFIVSKENCKEYLNFFSNYDNIIKTARLYIKKEMAFGKENKENKLKKSFYKVLYKAFKQIKNNQNEFKEAVINCQNFLILIILSLERKKVNLLNLPINANDYDMRLLLHLFVTKMNILYKINKYYSIIDHEYFYNKGIIKNINLTVEIDNFLHNEEIKRNKEKESDKAEEIEAKEEDEDDEKYFDEKDKFRFTLLDYIWLFNTSAKSDIVILFNERQKEKEFIKSVNRERSSIFLSFFDLLPTRESFLELNIKRDNLIEDTLNEVSKSGINLKKPLKIKFIGEDAVDEGGVRKEFFLLFIKQIFDPSYGMFSYNKKTRLYWFNHYSFEPKIKYELIGIILGLAIYNNIILDIKFPLSIYKKLLGIKPTLEDMKECDPELYNTFSFLKNTDDENLEEKLDIDFTVVDDKFGEKLVIPLKKNGENIMVDINNKDEYIKLYLDWYFNKSFGEVFDSFKKGFYKVISKDLSKILNPEEFELIVCGTRVLDLKELKRVCYYEEYTEDSITIKYFWEILLEFTEEEKKKFLAFVTGCDRAPIGGLGSLPITISKGGSDLNQLPSAHTCFNNLRLPDYKNKKIMKEKILISINYFEGFGFA